MYSTRHCWLGRAVRTAANGSGNPPTMGRVHLGRGGPQRCRGSPCCTLLQHGGCNEDSAGLVVTLEASGWDLVIGQATVETELRQPHFAPERESATEFLHERGRSPMPAALLVPILGVAIMTTFFVAGTRPHAQRLVLGLVGAAGVFVLWAWAKTVLANDLKALGVAEGIDGRASTATSGLARR